MSRTQHHVSFFCRSQMVRAGISSAGVTSRTQQSEDGCHDSLAIMAPSDRIEQAETIQRAFKWFLVFPRYPVEAAAGCL